MKTKEIEIWVRKDISEQVANFASEDKMFFFEPEGANKGCTKALLIIEIPEKKITISESEFDEVVDDWFYRATSTNLKFTDLVKELKQRLFAKEGDA